MVYEGQYRCQDEKVLDLKKAIKLLSTEIDSRHVDTVLAAITVGSVARGASNATTSDVDVLVVIEDQASDKDTFKLAKTLDQVTFPLDALVIRHSSIQLNTFPTEVEFLVKPQGVVWPERLREDTLLTRQDAAECGIWIAGSNSHYNVACVPWDLLLKSIAYIFPHLRQRFKNPALSLARAAFSIHLHRLCSKAEAGTWALSELGVEYHDLFMADLESYESGTKSELSPDKLLQLEQEIAETAGFKTSLR